MHWGKIRQHAAWRRWFWTIALAVTLLTMALATIGSRTDVPPEDQTTDNQPAVRLADYLIAFAGCEADCRDQKQSKIYLAHSSDAQQWQIAETWQSLDGTTPSLIRRGQTIYVYYADHVIKWDLMSGTQMIANVEISDEASNNLHAFADPSLTMDDNGRLVLFFLSVDRPPVWALSPEERGCLQGENHCPGDLKPTPAAGPGSCPAGASRCQRTILSAIEVPESDGTQFRLQAGERVRATVPGGGYFGASAVWRDTSDYILYARRNAQVEAYVSSQLNGEFRHRATIAGATGASGYYDPISQRYWTFITDDSTIKRAIHPTLAALSPGAFKAIFEAAQLGLTISGPPSFAPNQP